MRHDAFGVQRVSMDHLGRTQYRLMELERQVGQIAPREASDLRIRSGGFPANPRPDQQVYRPDLDPEGWYQYDEGTGMWNYLGTPPPP